MRDVAFNRKKIIGFLLFIALAVLGYQVFWQQKAQPQKAVATYMFLGNNNLAPLIYQENDAAVGLVVDITVALGEKMKHPIIIKAMNWTDAQRIVDQGVGDVLMQINETEERKLIYDFSEPLLESKFSIFTKKHYDIIDATSLRGLRVGVEERGYPKNILKSDPRIILADVKSVEDGFHRLVAGELDAVVTDQWVGAYILASQKISEVRIVGEPVASNYSTFAVKKGNTELLADINAGLKKMKEDGAYQDILKKWEPKQIVFQTRDQIRIDTLQSGLLTMLVALILVTALSVVIFLQRGKMQIEKERFQATLMSVGDAVISVDSEGAITVFNNVAERLTGWSQKEAMGLPLGTVFVLRDEESRSKLELQIARDRTALLISKTHREIPIEESFTFIQDSAGQKIGMVIVFRDYTEKKQKQQQLEYLSYHDPHTELLNQNALRQLSEQLSANAELNRARTVLFINLDDFRVINEGLGHREGDRIIFEVARKLESYIGNQGFLFRFGGDEFIIIVESDDVAYIADLAKGVREAIATQLDIINRFFYLSASIGICIGRKNDHIEQIIKNADTALYVAKKQKNTVTHYSQAMDKARSRETALEEDMSRALDNGEFELYFQPIVDIHKGVVDQAEALLRWNHPEFGQVSPAEFIPIAERTKFILPISDWVIEQACAKLAQWEALGLSWIALSINLSPACFENRGAKLADQIIRAVTAYGVKTNALKLEITESMLIEDPGDITTAFQRLDSLGVKLVLDDFGTGYSSFSTLMDIPLDIMKIDRSLINTIEGCGKGQKVVQSLITIIHGLDLEVVAEGVETQKQLAFLQSIGCNYVQGYLFSRPLPHQQFVAYCLAMQEQGKVLEGFNSSS